MMEGQDGVQNTAIWDFFQNLENNCLRLLEAC